MEDPIELLQRDLDEWRPQPCRSALSSQDVLLRSLRVYRILSRAPSEAEQSQGYERRPVMQCGPNLFVVSGGSFSLAMPEVYYLRSVKYIGALERPT